MQKYHSANHADDQQIRAAALIAARLAGCSCEQPEIIHRHDESGACHIFVGHDRDCALHPTLGDA